ncbi:MAG: ATP-dependent sacrificial sulfur transferase LarE [Desulfosoma sp.]
MAVIVKSSSDGIDRVRAAVGSEKTRRLEAVTAAFEAAAIAYSGGVDSTLLAYLLARVFKKRVKAVLVKSPFLAAREEAAALCVAAALQLPLEVLSVNLLAEAAVRENGPDRCYRCKAVLMETVLQKVDEGWGVVDGSHAGDAEKDRPGRKALGEKGVLSPLALAGWAKEDIRRTARAVGLPNWNKPSQSCLATRIPHGTPLDMDLLKRIEAAEDFLHETGCRHVRVRWISGSAKIQLGSADIPIVKDAAVHARLLSHMKQLGFSQIFVDPAPYPTD